MRTQGRRPGCLRDALLSLYSQSVTDFEVRLMVHEAPDRAEQIRGEIRNWPSTFTRRIFVHEVSGGNRTRPLNLGLEVAEGDYLAILDDDDLVFDHWVESFQSLGSAHPGQILRVCSVLQDYKMVGTELAPRASGPPARRFPVAFDFAGHTADNQSPIHTVAYPRALIEDGLRFDESISTLEDWDFLMRAVEIEDVASLPEITSLYRLWPMAESSSSAHTKAEWDQNRRAVESKLASNAKVVEGGGLAHLRKIASQNFAGPTVDAELIALRHELRALYDSTSWRWSSPVRSLAGALGRRYNPPEIDRLDKSQLARTIGSVRASLSWRITAPLRRGAKLLNR